MSGAVAAARREAEEALAEYDRLWGAAHATNAYGRAVVGLASALRALLAAGPEAPPPPSAEVREAAERLRSVLRVREQRSWCGSLACDAIYHEAEKLLAALRATASPAPGSEGVREAVSENDVYTLIGHAEYLRKVRGEEDMPKFFDGLARRLLAALDAGPETVGSARFEAAYQREHARLTEVLGALSEVLPPGAEIRPALLALKARAEASEPASKRGSVADPAPARRRAEEALAGWRTCLSIHDDDCFGCPEAVADALRALLAAGPEAPPPPSDEVREAAEVVRTILTAHDARLSESGALTYGPPSKGTGFVAAIQWLRRYDAARGGE